MHFPLLLLLLGAKGAGAIRSDPKPKIMSTAPKPQKCRQWISIEVDGRDEMGEPVKEIREIDVDLYNNLGGVRLFTKFKNYEARYSMFDDRSSPNQMSERAQVYYLGCNFVRGVPVFIAELGYDMEEKTPMVQEQFKTGHERMVVRLTPGEVIEFAWGTTFIFDLMVEGRITVKDTTGILEPPDWVLKKPSEAPKPKPLVPRLLKAIKDAFSVEVDEETESGSKRLTEPEEPEIVRPSREEELARLRQSGKKACTHSISVEIKATAHETKLRQKPENRTIYLHPQDYVRLGGYRIMRKFHPTEPDKNYWIRCDYDSGWPFLLVHQQGKDWEIRGFFFWNLYERKVSIVGDWRLQFLASFDIPELSNGQLKLSPIQTAPDEESPGAADE